MQEASQDASGMATAQRIKSVIKTTTPYDPRYLCMPLLSIFDKVVIKPLCLVSQAIKACCCHVTQTHAHCRSLRQMKQELKSLNKAKALPGMSDSEASDSTQYTGAVCAAQAADADEARSELCQALDSLNIGPKVPPAFLWHSQAMAQKYKPVRKQTESCL